MPKDLLDVGDVLLRAIRGVERGDVEPSAANALANLARAYVAVAESGRFERRIAEIEALLKERSA